MVDLWYFLDLEKDMIKNKLLNEQKILHLATVDPKGVPHIVPVWYKYLGGKIYIGTNTRTSKAKNIKKNKRVSFCIDVGIRSPNILGAMATGRASLILEKNKVLKIAKKILLRYFQTINNKSAKELLEDTDCIIEITPNQFSEWNY